MEKSKWNFWPARYLLLLSHFFCVCVVLSFWPIFLLEELCIPFLSGYFAGNEVFYFCLRKCLFLSGFHFFKLLTGLLDFCGNFHQQSKVSNDFVNFYSLLEDIFLILIFFSFSASKLHFHPHCVTLQFFPQSMWCMNHL